MESDFPTLIRRRRRISNFFLGAAALAVTFTVAAGGTFVFYANRPPAEFPILSHVEVEAGSSLRSIGAVLKEEGVIRSVALFNLYALLGGVAERLRAGSYVFPEPLTALGVVQALASGSLGTDSVRITVFEGMNIRDIDRVVTNALPNIPAGTFAGLADGYEGYLFPDTYYIPETFTAEELVNLMLETYVDRIAPLRDEIRRSGRTEYEILTMASILEREGNARENMEIIAGILWKRIDIDMHLQVDATLMYVTGRGSAGLTRADLADENNPYNTYVYKGLPPTPISNPGLRAIRAALRPQQTPYLFYLTGRDGVFYYGRTGEEHLENKRLHLD